MNSLEEAIENLDKILAHILIEQDLRLKGIQVGHGWSQLKVIKQAISKLGFLDRRIYKKKLEEMENRLLVYEDNYISEKIQEALEDVQKVNELLNNYKTQLIIERRKDIEEKLTILQVELERIYEKNKNKTEQKWVEMKTQISGVLGLIVNVLNSKSDTEFNHQREQMNQILKTVYQQKRIKEEEEEQLLQIAVEMEKLNNLQREIDLQLQNDNQKIDQIQDKQGFFKNIQEQQFNQAYEYVQMRRRQKVKLFIQGLFTYIGSWGGKVGAAFGFALGRITGNKISQAVTNSSIS